MAETKASSFSLSLIWFGAAISISEIATGVLFSPLGLARGLAATFIGHFIGFVILILAGCIGAKSRLSSAESTRISFGVYGSYFFSILNILQLVGWTAIMIINGALSMDAISRSVGFGNFPLWCVVIGTLIAVWILLGLKNLSKVNVVVVTALLLLCIVLGVKVFTTPAIGEETFETMSFGAAVELSVAMPLSWLPLIADYTRNAKNPVAGTVASAVCYTIGSCFMYFIGMGAAIYAGSSDISAILLASGMGAVALVIVLFSTVTTTFLDAYSAGVSAANLTVKIKEKYAALITTIIGTILAIFVSMSQYETFLYFIGSVFAPLFAILFMDYFVFHITKKDGRLLNVKNFVLWVLGFCIYRILMNFDIPLGSTLPVMLIMAGICLLCHGVEKKWFSKA